MRFFRISLLLALSPIYVACSGSGPEAPPALDTLPKLSSDNRVEVDENHRGSFFTLSADSAADGEPLRFSITGPDAEHFTLDAATGALRFVQPPDFEAPADEDGDNQYQLTATVEDRRGRSDSQALTVVVNNVVFAYEFISPLPNTIVERERYSRLPIAMWMEYDHPEKMEVKCDGEILNPDSESGLSWTGSIQLGFGQVVVDCVFWRGSTAIADLQIPVRHQYVLSDDRYLVYDELNDQFIVPLPERLEAILIDAETGESYKRYPWVDVVPQIQDAVADPNQGGALFTEGGSVLRLEGNDTVSVTGPLDSPILSQPHSTLSYDALNQHLYASGTDSRYARIDLADGSVSNFQYDGSLTKPAGSRVEMAWDTGANRLFFASGSATGVEAVEPGGALLNHFPFHQPQRWSDMVYEPSRDHLFISSHSDHQILRLDPAAGTYQALAGSGAALKAPRTLVFDPKHDRLATISSGRLLTVDPETGARSVLFDSSVGQGATSGGFSGIWVAADSTHARAADRQLGHFYHIDLRTGQMTPKTYTWANSDPTLHSRDFQVRHAKFNASGAVAAVHYRTVDLDSAENYLDLVFLDQGGHRRLVTNGELVDFSFSRPHDQLLVVLLRDQGDHTLSTYDLASGERLRQAHLPTPANFTPLALQQVEDDLYILGRDLNGTAPVFQLIRVAADQSLTTLVSYPDYGTGLDEGAGINSLYHDSVLAVLFPEQAPQFWDLHHSRDFYMDFSPFRGSDQPKDFYTIDDYTELYFFRDRGGLNLCWRFHCAIQAN